MRIKFERERLLRSTILAGAVAAFGVASAPAFAQESDEGADRERIVITGSRLSRDSNYTSPNPVNVFNSEQIELSGAVNTSELIRTLPAAGVSGLTSTNSNFLVGSSGINTVELRNLGEDRTLVLVNGRRFVAGVPGSNIVDFNSIPTEFIERVDVLTGASSAIYGSDALAGVVNVILRDDFEGVTASHQYGISDQGDDETYQASVTLGSQFAGDRGSALASVTWSREDGVFARNRDGLERDFLSEIRFTGDPADFGVNSVPFYSSFSERGRIQIPNDGAGSSNFVFDETTGEVRPFVSANDDGSALDGFNRQAFRAIAVPTERFLFSSVANYEVSPAFNVFFEGTYASTETQSSLEPFPLSSADIFGDNDAQFIDDDGDGVPDRSAFGISILNPFVPEGIRDEARARADFDGDGIPDIADEDLVVGFARRTTELTQRGANNLRQTARFVLGVDGALSETWRYETSLNFGRTVQAQQSTGQINVVNFRYALDVMPDPENPGQYICADDIARAQGCVPINIFGQGSISPEAADYVRALSTRDATVEQAVFNAYVTGDTFLQSPFADSAASVAFGTEYRSERSESVPDALSQAGLNAGNISPIVSGDFQVFELFAESSVPLIQGRPFAQDLSLNLAARYSDYTTVGNTFAWAAGLEWAPSDWVRFRAQYAEAVRAPNIGELFQPQSETFEGGVDPCQGLTTSGGTAAFFTDPSDETSGVDAATVGSDAALACIGDPAVAARVARDGFYIQTQAELQGIGGFNGGNPGLFEESGETITVGFVFTPNTGNQWYDNFGLSVDYFDIEITDAIGSVGRQTSLNECYLNSGGVFDPASPFCQNIVRYASGPTVGAIRELNAVSQNLASIQTSGVDVQASYQFALNDLFGGSAPLGDLATQLTYTWLESYDSQEFPGADITDSAGTDGLFDHEFLFSAVYYNGPLTVAYDVNWLAEAVATNDPNSFFFGVEFPSVAFHDIQVRYDLFDTGVTLVGGVDNISDEFVSYSEFGDTGTGTAGAIYDAIGRRYYLGVRAQF